MFFDKKLNLNKKTLIIVGLIVAIVSAAGITYSIKNSKVKSKEVPIDTIAKRKIAETATETGNIAPNYRSDILLNSSQEVLKVAVKEGSLVKKGDLLVLLDTSDSENQLGI